jgi:hypothetical protein
MTTGRINQVTFLSERDPPSQRGPAGGRYPLTRKGPEPLGVISRTKRRIAVLYAQGQVSLVSLILPLRYSSYKAASHAGRTGTRGFPKKNV